jgi:lauroyl/myristoyl acyltransferase
VADPHSTAPHSAGLYRAVIFDLGAGLARVLPLGVLRAFASAVGWLYARMHPEKVAIVERNLRLLDASLNVESARRVYPAFAKTLADYFYLGTRPAEQALRIVTKSEGVDYLRKIQAEGKGALVVTAHYGLFELGGMLMAQMGIPTVVLTYPEPSKALTEWRAAFRRRWKAETIEIGKASSSRH